ncbi:DUF2914 domain-containing protein [Salisaeta longa]|uniref:DUF2914 domain-containing protein n=1 Tax=Salisaeta longa TaxID=503170 RepID=UPI0003B5DCF8|nr:DUF2914 domain-containing protein [Salisaeta longa]
MASTTDRTAAAFLSPLIDRLKRAPRYRLVRRLYHRHEHLAPPLLFLGGVGWDAATLKRIDAPIDDLILFVYLLLLGAAIVLAVLKRNDRLPDGPLAHIGEWSEGGLQFFAGGLFSAYVIYYTQSASLTTASLFLLVLVAVLVANEFIWSRTFNVAVLLGVYFLAVFCYGTFALPILLGFMGYGLFLLAGVLALAVVGGLLYLFRQWKVVTGWKPTAATAGVALGLFGLVNLFYVQNWIPPVPLAMKAGGIYHDVTIRENVYRLTYEAPAWYEPWRASDEVFHYVPGDTVYCFVSVFAPSDLRTRITHNWQYYDARREEWIGTDRIGYRLVGGRARGYRGYTYKRNVRPGAWRVNVLTTEDRLVGRIRFSIVRADTTRRRSFAVRRYE